MPSLQNNFEIEFDASGDAMGVVPIQGGSLLNLHSKSFHGAFLNYHSSDKISFP